MTDAPATIPARSQPAVGRWNAFSPWLQRIGRWGAILLLAVVFGFGGHPGWHGHRGHDSNGGHGHRARW